MKMIQNPLILFAVGISFAPAVTLFQDNFDAPDTANLDLSDQAGRRSGIASDIQIRSSRIQHGIADNQLDFLDTRTGRIRFHNDPDNDNTTAGEWHDWAAGVTGTSILSARNLRVSFDWIAGNDTSENWVSINMGVSGPGLPEPGFRVNHSETDIGMLLRFNGLTELFDNGANLGPQGAFPASIGTRRVTLDYTIGDFADGANVGLIANVDGTEVYNGNPFTLDNNGGELYFEIGTLENTRLAEVFGMSDAVAGEKVSVLA
jgi:hypothetical protein